MLVTFEGIDGTGKSSLLYGWEEVEHGEVYHVPGLIDRLTGEGCDVLVTCEPGTPHFRPVELPAHLNWCDPLLWWAGMRTKPGAAFRLIRMARQMHEYGTSLSSFGRNVQQLLEADLSGISLEGDVIWPGLLAERDGLARTLGAYSARDALRHALIYAHDAPRLSPEASGLVFLANHVLHQDWLIAHGVRSSSRIVLSDRYAASQLAYGRARQTSPLVERLYSAHTVVEPDLTVLLVADRETVACRLEERARREERLRRPAKQAGKSWGDLDTLMRAQYEYMSLEERCAQNPSCSTCWVVIDTSDLGLYDLVDAVLELLPRPVWQAEK